MQSQGSPPLIVVGDVATILHGCGGLSMHAEGIPNTHFGAIHGLIDVPSLEGASD